MNCLVIAVFVCVFAATYSSDTDMHYQFEESVNDIDTIMKMIMQPRVPERYLPDDYFQNFGKNPNTKLKSFSFKNCGDFATETLRVIQFKITPDPIVLPGQLGISFFLQNLKMDTAPIQIDVTLKKKILGLWIEIPCIDNIGSCSYADACELLDQVQCPQAFPDNKIPCQCPIPMGNFTLPETQFEVNLSSIPTGDYSAVLAVTLDSGSKACYEVDVTLA